MVGGGAGLRAYTSPPKHTRLDAASSATAQRSLDGRDACWTGSSLRRPNFSSLSEDGRAVLLPSELDLDDFAISLFVCLGGGGDGWRSVADGAEGTKRQ